MFVVDDDKPWPESLLSVKTFISLNHGRQSEHLFVQCLHQPSIRWNENGRRVPSIKRRRKEKYGSRGTGHYSILLGDAAAVAAAAAVITLRCGYKLRVVVTDSSVSHIIASMFIYLFLSLLIFQPSFGSDSTFFFSSFFYYLWRRRQQRVQSLA